MSNSFSTTESDWQGVDDEPTDESQNLVKSNGVFKLHNSLFVGNMPEYETRKGYGYTDNLSVEYMGEQYRATKIDVSSYNKRIITFYAYGYCGFILNDTSTSSIIRYGDSDYNNLQYLYIPSQAKYLCISWAISLHEQEIKILGNDGVLSDFSEDSKVNVDSANTLVNSFILKNGNLTNSGGFSSTSYIDIRRFAGGYSTICASIYGAAGLAFYDKNKNFIYGIDGSTDSEGEPSSKFGISSNQDIREFGFYIPKNAYYVRLSIVTYLYNGNNVYIKGKFQLRYNEDIDDLLIFKNEKILIIGDSISTDKISENYFERNSQLFPNYNYYASYGLYDKWVYDLVNNGKFPITIDNSSIHATGFVARYQSPSIPGDANDFVTRLELVPNPSSYDVVIIFGGINDWIQSIPMGTGEESVTTHFKPAVNEFFSYLIEHFINARIVVFTPLKAYDTGNNFGDGNNNVGLKQIDYVEYIEEVAEKYALPVIDLHSHSGFCPSNTVFRNTWTYKPEGSQVGDGVHPSKEYFQRFLADYIYKNLKTI